MEQNESSIPVSQPSMMELGGNKKDHHLSSWTENETHNNYSLSWNINPKENLDILNKKRKTNFHATQETHFMIMNIYILIIINVLN